MPTTATHNGAGDLGLRFLYVGEFDVQWDAAFGLDLQYMQARHYSPALGRFLQPDPDRSEANLYAYAANNPVTEIDPDGTCFIVCQLVIGAVIDAVSYAVTTDNFSLGGMAQAVVGGAVESAVNPLAKLNKVSKLVKATSKVLSKVPKATRKVQRIVNRSGVHYDNGWRTADGRFAKAPTSGRPLAGQRAEERVWDAIDAKPGWPAIRGRVTVVRGGQRRVFDGAARSPSGRVIGLEVKSGGARRKPAQRLFDRATSRSSPAVGVGRHAGLSSRSALPSLCMARESIAKERRTLTLGRSTGRRAQIGDLFEVSTARGLAYVQYMHDFPHWSPLVRVLPGHFSQRPDDLASLVAGPTRFVMLYPITSTARDSSLATWAGTFPVPEHAEPPKRFRRPDRVKDFRTVSWAVWDLYRDIRPDVPVPLPDDIRNMPHSAVFNHAALVDAIERDWTWSVALDDYDAEEASGPATTGSDSGR